LAIKIIPFILGPIENNSYLVIDLSSQKGAIVDPSFGSKQILDEAVKNHIHITQIWCTHAHFDHISGINEIMPEITPSPEIYLHKDDLPLWKEHGGAKLFGFPFENNYSPTQFLKNSDSIQLGETYIQTRFTPGHTPGHIIYLLSDENIVFCGDLIFRMSVGRTDLPGGNHSQLLRSIEQEIKPLPDETRLLSGHGPETTVQYEKKHNPFL
jgi:glyoxylase-like metal-dependent hydrolase (beta-lactamase superfamily II)